MSRGFRRKPWTAYPRTASLKIGWTAYRVLAPCGVHQVNQVRHANEVHQVKEVHQGYEVHQVNEVHHVNEVHQVAKVHQVDEVHQVNEQRKTTTRFFHEMGSCGPKIGLSGTKIMLAVGKS